MIFIRRGWRALIWRYECLAVMVERIHRREIVKVGDRYEDCAYRILTCVMVSYSQDYMVGIDENGKKWGCSPTMCGIEIIKED